MQTDQGQKTVKTCGAKCRDGHPCGCTALMPNGRCKRHGGKSGRPIKHARYSKSVPADMAARYEYFKTDPEWLSLKPELALARANMERFMATFVEGQRISADMGSELRAWYDCLGRLAERANKILNGEQYTITLEGAQALLARLADIVTTSVNEHYKDGPEAILERVADGLEALQSRKSAV